MKNIDYSLYLVTNRAGKTEEEFITTIEQAILGGVTVVQLREKDLSTGKFYRLASKVKELTSKYDIPLIINDRLDIALAINADGVHVGQSDMPGDIVRSIIGKNKILGISAATIKDTIKAEKDGADYIGSGAIFPTQTKDADCITIDYLKEIVNAVNIPIIAIGGLTEDNIESLVNTNIGGISLVSAIMESNNPKKTVQKLKTEFELL
ncbi:thiamine phosphate synthase [Methanobrevibacter sp. TMH8]|uniref:thiamine phosphate synthase n=1 Tax=Methanobrevibacter sp. TMH8 TaxID=2848611 RepID=UPI001CCF2B8E|nr:thiamine phosphate synthase [Methanobrevibacter sp. TMH8]MBZ9570027.1 thiamine phosphate synthase [Methanobrevibacter sp. TMH8]